MLNEYIIIITRFYSLTNVPMLLLRLDSNSYSLLVGSACLQKQTDVRHAAAWKRLDLNSGPPDTKQLLYHLCYLVVDVILVYSRILLGQFFAFYNVMPLSSSVLNEPVNPDPCY